MLRRRSFAPQLARTLVLLPRAWAGALLGTRVSSLAARSGRTVAHSLAASLHRGLCTICRVAGISSGTLAGVSVSHLALIALLVIHLLVVVVAAQYVIVVVVAKDVAEDVVHAAMPGATATHGAQSQTVRTFLPSPKICWLFDAPPFHLSTALEIEASLIAQ